MTLLELDIFLKENLALIEKDLSALWSRMVPWSPIREISPHS